MVLDNFEQVGAASPLVGELLAACPHLVVLITSRVPLQLPGELTYPVQPLAVLEAHEAPALEEAASNPAVRLFVERAREARAGFTLDADNAATVTEVCRRLEGLPLAIELAAARTRVLSLASILTRLARPLALLTDGRAGSPSRQRTLRQTIAWSYDLLAPDEQALFRRLAVFVDGFDLDAAAAIAVVDEDDRDDEWGALDGVASLVDKSLLRRLGEAEGRTPV